jgi:hypothetical protein
VQGDARLAAQYRAQLSQLRRPTMIAALHAEATGIAANLMTAKARHDTQAVARYRQQFSSLCADAHAGFELDFCGWTLP